jgi:hypothetical protein
MERLRRYRWVLGVLVAVTCLGAGVSLGQYQMVKSWALTLCTSCVGLGR